MANASGFFAAPSVPRLRGKIQPSIRIYGSGFRSLKRESPRGYSAPAPLKAHLELPLLKRKHPGFPVKDAN